MNRWTTVFAAVCCVLALAGCKTSGGSTKNAGAAAQGASISDYPQPDTTYLAYDEPFTTSHGFQVEYFGQNGETALWYPGNQTVVAGAWRLSKNETKICFYYEGMSRAEITNVIDDQPWACDWLMPRRRGLSIVSALRGNPLGLQGGEPVPYVLKKCEAPGEFRSMPPSSRFSDCKP